MQKEKSKIQAWLDRLQQESWQLELIISSILLLIIGSYDEIIPDLILQYKSNEGFDFAYIVAILIPILVFIKSNLIAHIFLRGLWIGCIGLRYVSVDIDYNAFNYSGIFDRFLKKKIPRFDEYIEKLERFCSIIFSYSFLMVFHFLSFSIFLTLIQVLNYFGWRLVYDTFLEPILSLILYILSIAGILNFIDFITIGNLKKKKFISFIFYPFYRIYNLFSFAFLYRPIHYNFISNKLGRTYMLLMLPYMFLLAILGNDINYHEYIYIPKKEQGSNWIMYNNYNELRKNSLIEHVTIEKMFYNNDEPLKLFLRVYDSESTNKLIEKICPDIKPYERHDYSVRPFDAVNISIVDKYHRKTSTADHEARIEKSLSCISEIFEVSIDSTRMQSLDYVFHKHPNAGEKGLLTGININELESGKHKLIVKIKHLDNDTIAIAETIQVPFFKN